SAFDARPNAIRLPPDWARIRDFLANSSDPHNQRINEHIDTYVQGLQDPKLIVEILSTAVRSAWANRRSINWALREMARVSAQARGIPLKTIPNRGGRLFTNRGFFAWAFQRSYFIDLPLVGPGDHTAIAHLVQDLVADRAFIRAGEAMSGPEFRSLLKDA